MGFQPIVVFLLFVIANPISIIRFCIVGGSIQVIATGFLQNLPSQRQVWISLKIRSIFNAFLTIYLPPQQYGCQPLTSSPCLRSKHTYHPSPMYLDPQPKYVRSAFSRQYLSLFSPCFVSSRYNLLMYCIALRRV